MGALLFFWRATSRDLAPDAPLLGAPVNQTMSVAFALKLGRETRHKDYGTCYCLDVPLFASLCQRGAL